MKFSASPFACGCNGVTQWCLNPSSDANIANSLELNGGPLSLSSRSGVPYVAKNFSFFLL